MKLIQEIQKRIADANQLKEQETAELLKWIDEETAKPSIGIREASWAAQERAGEREWVRGMAQDQQEPLQAPASKPIFLMGKQLPPRTVTLTKDGRAIVRAKGRTFEYQAEDQGDKIVLR